MKSFKRLFTFFSLVFLFTGVLVGVSNHRKN